MSKPSRRGSAPKPSKRPAAHLYRARPEPTSLAPQPGPVEFITTREDERRIATTPRGLPRLVMAFERLALVLQ